MQPYQQRVIDEKTELDEKISKLDSFLRSEKSDNLDDGERDRMSRQRSAMDEYSLVLSERISNFT